MSLLIALVVGLFAGLIARAIIPGTQKLGCIGTSLLGVVGSVVGGTLWNALTGSGLDFTKAGFLGSVIGAVIVLIVAKKFGKFGADGGAD